MRDERHPRRAGGTRRVAVLEAAASVLASKGFENTRFSDVSAASGVAVSTLQSYFGSRDDMLIEAMRLATEREVQALEGLADDVTDPWDRLVAMVDRNLDSPIGNPQLLIEFWRTGMRDTELRDYAQEGWARYKAPFVKATVDGCDAGAFAPSSDPEVAADLLLASLAGAMIARVLNLPTCSDSRFRTALLGEIAGLVGRRG